MPTFSQWTLFEKNTQIEFNNQPTQTVHLHLVTVLMKFCSIWCFTSLFFLCLTFCLCCVVDQCLLCCCWKHHPMYPNKKILFLSTKASYQISCKKILVLILHKFTYVEFYMKYVPQKFSSPKCIAHLVGSTKMYHRKKSCRTQYWFYIWYISTAFV